MRASLRWQRPLTSVAILLLLTSVGSTGELGVDDIVAKCTEAMGGKERIERLKTISFRVGSGDTALLWEIVRPNMVRKERPGRLILVFDGTRAGFLQGPPRADGTLEGPHLVDPADWHHFEMDIALFIPAFFDYPAEHVGQTVVAGSAAYLLHVDLPSGGEVVYAVDTRSFLPVKVMLPDWDLERSLGGYREIDGVSYFSTYSSDPESATAMHDLELDLELDPSRFTLPPSIE